VDFAIWLNCSIAPAAMERLVLNALDLYLSTAGCAELVAYASLGILTVGLGPWGIADLVEHVRAARIASRGAC
jgi:hypothetical protein